MIVRNMSFIKDQLKRDPENINKHSILFFDEPKDHDAQFKIGLPFKVSYIDNLGIKHIHTIDKTTFDIIKRRVQEGKKYF